MKILVTGGAGYIGSHTILGLMENGLSPVVVDNFYSGHTEAVKAVEKYTGKDISLYKGDFSDTELLEKILKKHDIKGIIHFAAHSLVGESMKNPTEYYRENVAKTVFFLEFLKEKNIDNFVLSSSAAVYGIPENIPIEESDNLNPINPYGNTKLVVENLLEYMKAAHGFNYISLRYFNAAGAHPSGIIGEDHNPETHLIPNVMKSMVTGESRARVFGNDYPTLDGTAVRDYVHVSDLANAHVLALKYLIDGGTESVKSSVYNLGDGKGYSVLDIIKTIERITSMNISLEFTERRPGDPPVLVASHEKIKNELGFRFQYNIDDIIASAWKWHSGNVNGFSKKIK